MYFYLYMLRTTEYIEKTIIKYNFNQYHLVIITKFCFREEIYLMRRI